MVEFWLENLLRLRYCRKILNADQNSRRVVTETFVASRASSGWWMILMWQKFRPKSAATRRERGGGRTTPPWLSIYLLSNYGGEREDPTEMSEREFWKPTARYYYLNVLINIRSYTGSVRATSLILSEMIIGWMLTVVVLMNVPVRCAERDFFSLGWLALCGPPLQWFQSENERGWGKI